MLKIEACNFYWRPLFPIGVDCVLNLTPQKFTIKWNKYELNTTTPLTLLGIESSIEPFPGIFSAIFRGALEVKPKGKFHKISQQYCTNILLPNFRQVKNTFVYFNITYKSGSIKTTYSFPFHAKKYSSLFNVTNKSRSLLKLAVSPFIW